MEQNTVPGVANRWLSGVAREVYAQFEASRTHFREPERVQVLGNPLRHGITDGSREAALERLAFDASRRTLLVLGGSQGAKHLNEVVCDALGGLAKIDGLQIIHQAGARDEAWVRERHEAAGAPSVVEGFIEDMPDVLAVADLILGRSGATTLAEIAAVGRASILVPFPHATGDHQTLNARVYEKAGAATIVPDAGLDAAIVVKLVGELLKDDAKRNAMAEAALGLAKPNATRDICDRIMNIIKATNA
jgi:UDP-N-acetylglucosamine--N-acetylmuramyl-(pentapeptide) pyrophosphoryl-undecaprenol N-acetylglucosamine transferase